MSRTLNGLFAAVTLAALMGCTSGPLSDDYGGPPQRGIDADISATHSGDAPLISNEGPRGSELWRQ